MKKKKVILGYEELLEKNSDQLELDESTVEECKKKYRTRKRRYSHKFIN